MQAHLIEGHNPSPDQVLAFARKTIPAVEDGYVVAARRLGELEGEDWFYSVLRVKEGRVRTEAHHGHETYSQAALAAEFAGLIARGVRESEEDGRPDYDAFVSEGVALIEKRADDLSPETLPRIATEIARLYARSPKPQYDVSDALSGPRLSIYLLRTWANMPSAASRQTLEALNEARVNRLESSAPAP